MSSKSMTTPALRPGVEDMILKDKLYHTIMKTMYDRVRMKREGKSYVPSKIIDD